MQSSQETEVNSSSSKYSCFPTRFLSSNSPLPENEYDGETAPQKQPGGWKAMPYILGSETCERLASNGMGANLMVFLQTQFNMDQVLATNVINIWTGFSNFLPLIGAFISDTFLGRFRTIAYAMVASFMGMLTLTLIDWVPALHPPKCKEQCIGPTKFQFGVLVMALGFISIGSAGIRPCSTALGVDQFDSSTVEGRRRIASFFNWYYMSFAVVVIFTTTVMVYIQTSLSWVLGLGIPTVVMLCSFLLFLAGARLYVYVKPDGSVFTSIAQVIVAAYKKQKLKIPDHDGVYYDPPLEGTLVKKLSLTNKLRFFNKAALITEGAILADGTNSNPWRLCSSQKVEETKCVVKVIPIWASGIIFSIAMAQQGTFTVSQAIKMNRNLMSRFQISAGSITVISMITITLFIPIYDRIFVPSIRKVTRVEGGITLLQRMGVGIIFSVVSMVVAGLVERMRRASALAHVGSDGIAPLSVLWLAPQLILLGLAEAFNVIGQIEFYNKEIPENVSSLANSLFYCAMAIGNYLSAFVVHVMHRTTGRPDWLANDINEGRVENLYFLIAGLGVLNLGYFVWVARGYQYKGSFEDNRDIELADSVRSEA